MTTVAFDFDWVTAAPSSDKLSHATMAELAIRIDEHSVTAVLDRRARSYRDWVVVPLLPLAEWLARKVESVQKKPIEVGSLDINLYRDDLSEVRDEPVVGTSELPFSVTGKGIILVDDVLCTGRTIRSAMNALIEFGRPRFIRLMVMIDRGWRELPIQPDYVGNRVKTSMNENVKVMLEEIDGQNKIVIRQSGSKFKTQS